MLERNGHCPAKILVEVFGVSALRMMAAPDLAERYSAAVRKPSLAAADSAASDWAHHRASISRRSLLAGSAPSLCTDLPLDSSSPLMPSSALSD